MDLEITHGFDGESFESKIEWFSRLSVEERLEILSDYYELAVALEPRLREGRDVEAAPSVVHVVELPAG